MYHVSLISCVSNIVCFQTELAETKEELCDVAGSDDVEEE